MSCFDVFFGFGFWFFDFVTFGLGFLVFGLVFGYCVFFFWFLSLQFFVDVVQKKFFFFASVPFFYAHVRHTLRAEYVHGCDGGMIVHAGVHT